MKMFDERQILASEAIDIMTGVNGGLNGTGLIRLNEILEKLGLNIRMPLNFIADRLKEELSR